MIKIAVAQLCSSPAIKNNLNICCSLISEAARNGAKAIFFPEASDFISSKANAKDLAQPLEGEFVSEILKASKAASILVSIGVHELTGPNNKFYNSHLLINKGEILAVYRKIHLFDVEFKDGSSLRESETTVRGQKFVEPIKTDIGKIGLATCYDIRFPEYSGLLRLAGMDILTYPSAFTITTGKSHWEVLLRARAIENQCFVVAAAQCGYHTENRSSFGHSMVINAWGEVLMDLGIVENQIGYCNIDMATLETIRTNMPTIDQRRTDIYKLGVVG